MTARVVVVGGGFGRIHARGVGERLAGIAGRGGAASRELADQHSVPYFDLSRGMDEVAQAADVVSVAVGSAISGGPGTELAQAFMARGLHVLQEHPLHPDEILAAARTARKHGVQHRVNLHYRHVPPVRIFIEAAQRLLSQSELLFVDAASPVHVLHPLIDVLAAALGGVRPWAWQDVHGDGPLRSVTGTFGGAPITLRVQNQLDPLDRDNHALLWHRIALGTSAGVLTLADTHGPVLWSPRWHAERDEHHRLVLDGSFSLPQSTTILPGSEPISMREVMATWWPEAVAHSLEGLLEGVGGDPLKQAQLDLTTARIWNDLTTRLGPPERITATAPPTVQLSPPEGLAPTGYSVEAEFYDLIAGRRTTAIEAVVEALDGVDGPIVEVGAGTGLLTTAIARALPAVKIIAAEPDPVMRAVLTSKVVRDPDLRDRVSIVDGSAPDLALPDQIGAAVVCGVAGHLSVQDRRTLWRRLAERLTPAAPLVVELLALDPVALDRTRLGQARIGQDEVRWWLSTQPEADGTTMTSTWEVLREGRVQRSVSAEHTWQTVTLPDVAAESGLHLQVLVKDGANPLGVFTRTQPAQEEL